MFDEKSKTAARVTYTASDDDPPISSIGPSFFESYQTWPDVKFIHGFNLAKNGTKAAASLTKSVPYACKALSKDSLLYWEMGNEPDLYKTSAQGAVRPQNWNEADYVTEWSEKTEIVKKALSKGCGKEWVTENIFKWIAPSFAGTRNSLDVVKSWKHGLDKSNVIAKISSHR